MELVLLTVEQVKKTISDNKIIFREFYMNKIVYGYVQDGKVIAMCPTSINKQLLNARKIYSPYVAGNNVEIGTNLINDVVSAVWQKDSDVIIYADFLDGVKPMFENAGFKIAYNQNRLKRYGLLWRGVTIYAKIR